MISEKVEWVLFNFTMFIFTLSSTRYACLNFDKIKLSINLEFTFCLIID